jgi:hypothetical protein
MARTVIQIAADPTYLYALATIRAVRSVMPPAAYVSMIVMGCVGYACALAIRETAGRATALAVRCRN